VTAQERLARLLAEAKARRRQKSRASDRPADDREYPYLDHTGKQRPKPREDPPKPAPGKIVRTYDYRGASNELLYQVVRFEPKAFRQRRPGPEGGWLWSLNGTERVLFRLPSVLSTVAVHGLVMVVEGEKDAESLIAHGLCATTCAQGAGAWRDEYSRSLIGAGLVAVIPDNDRPGRVHASQVADSLVRHGVRTRVVNLPDLQDKGDVTEWLTLQGTVGELMALIRDTPDVTGSRDLLYLAEAGT
jgi:putative DNA primase/helicase